MEQQKQILLDNALVSWANAIRYSDQIRNGKITLAVRKKYVSALHNAVELFLKQIMLNKCDYRVAEPRNISASGEPAKSYYTSKNLNLYFETLDPRIRKKFVSIEFSKFFDFHKELLCDYLQSGNTFKEDLRLINDLRNNETHFYIERTEYLTEHEFCRLYNFMIDFYQILYKYGLFPFESDDSQEHRRLILKKKHFSSFSYKDAIKKSSQIQYIAKKANGMLLYETKPLTTYEKAAIISLILPEYAGIKFDELWTYIETLDQFHMIDVIDLGPAPETIIRCESGDITSGIGGREVFEIKINLS